MVLLFSYLAQCCFVRIPLPCQDPSADVVCDAVFTNDEMATGVLRALYERGRRVPADVAVVGCDGLSLGRQTIPQLTTVRLDYEQMGQAAVERLFSSRDKNAPVFRVRFVPELVVRESS